MLLGGLEFDAGATVYRIVSLKVSVEVRDTYSTERHDLIPQQRIMRPSGMLYTKTGHIHEDNTKCGMWGREHAKLVRLPSMYGGPCVTTLHLRMNEEAFRCLDSVPSD